MLLSMNITVTEIFMKTYDYRGSVIKEGNKTTSIAYVQCACGCLASRMSSNSDKYKCSWCKRTYMLGKEIYRWNKVLKVIKGHRDILNLCYNYCGNCQVRWCNYGWETNFVDYRTATCGSSTFASWSLVRRLADNLSSCLLTPTLKSQQRKKSPYLR